MRAIKGKQRSQKERRKKKANGDELLLLQEGAGHLGRLAEARDSLAVRLAVQVRFRFENK